MNARHELGREAEAILHAGGFRDAVAKHHGPFWTVYGVFAGNEQSGHTQAQADPQDPRELARRLVAGVKAEPDLEEIPEAPETVEEAFPLGEGPFDPQPEPEQIPEHETHGETGEETSAADQNAESGASERSEFDGAEFDVGGAAISGPTDAEFSVHDLPQIELIEPDANPDFGAELLEFEDELADEPDDQAARDAAYIFGDNLYQMRTAAIGLVSTHAALLTAEIEAASGEQEGEYADLQSFVVTNLDKHTGAFTLQDAPSLMRYHRWSELDATRAAVRTIDRVRKEKTAFLLSAERAEIEAFDPSEGWP